VSTAAGYVERALLASRVVDGEPVDPLGGSVSVPADGNRLVCFFMDLDESAGIFVVHRWIRNGEIAAEITLESEADPRGRVFSSRSVGPDEAGTWRVDALSPQGQLLASTSFTVVVDTDAAATLAEEPASE
jgi:hypothetical protein